MKIAFICGSLEPGFDGVGDYTRRLAAGLIKTGHEVIAIAYSDRLINEMVVEAQQADGVVINVLRLPANMPNSERVANLKRHITMFRPHWVSLQYVLYAYHKRGMAFSLPNELRSALGDMKLHIMYHELWQGESSESTLKDKIIGYFQKSVSLKLISRLRPRHITTTNEYYKRCFKKSNIEIDKIPVFSNMPLGDRDGKQAWERLPAPVLSDRNNYVIAGFFGGFHSHADVPAKIVALRDRVKLELNKKLLVVHIGRSGGINTIFESITSDTSVEMCVLGEWPEQDVANLIAQIDLGLSNYPKVLAEKSGSIAALLHNGCPTLILRKGFEEDTRTIDELKELDEVGDLKSFIEQNKAFSHRYDVDRTIERYQKIFV